MGTILLLVGLCAVILLVGMGLLAYGVSQDMKAKEFDSVFGDNEDYV